MKPSDNSEISRETYEMVIRAFNSGISPELVSQLASISYEQVEALWFSYISEPKQVLSFFRALNQKSSRYKCQKLGTLMRSPVIAADHKIYEKSCIEDWVRTHHNSPITGEPLSEDQITPLNDLKNEIINFSKSVISELEVYLKAKIEAALELSAECLSTLSPYEDLDSFLKILKSLDKTRIPSLLKSMPIELIKDLQYSLTDFDETFWIQTSLYLKEINNFEYFMNLLQTKPDELIELAIVSVKSFDISEVNRIRQVIKQNIFELKAAESLAIKGNTEAAREIIEQLKANPDIQTQIIELYDKLEWTRDKQTFIELCLKRRLSEVSDPIVQECLNLLLLHSKSNSEKPQSEVPHKVDSNILPQRVYSLKTGTNQLYWTNIKSGEEYQKNLPNFTFLENCSLNESPIGDLWITGGKHGEEATNEVWRVETKDFKIASKPSMNTPRSEHNSIFFEGTLYVIGGKLLKECEKFVNDRWEAVPPLPNSTASMGLSVLNGSIFSLGGCNEGSWSNNIYELSYSQSCWRTLPFTLPIKSKNLASFKISDTELWFVQGVQLYNFHRFKGIRQVRTLGKSITSYYGPSYYRSGVLYCSNMNGPAQKIELV